MEKSANPKASRQNEENRRWIENLLIGATNREWFGEMNIVIKRGVIEKVVCKESLKPPKAGT